MTVVLPERPAQTGPANSVTDEETGARVYIHPITGERFDSVTTILDIVAKDGLPYWAAKVVQEKAVEMLPRLVAGMRRKPCDAKGSERCGACMDCLALELRRAPDDERDQAADRGKRIHHLAEQYAIHGVIRDHDDDIVDYVKQWNRWREQHEVTFDASEVTVISRRYGYAGTLDGIVRCGWMPPKWKHLIGVPLYEDYKSGKGIYNGHAKQVAAYRNADAVLLPDGTELEMPPGDPTYGLVVQVRPDNWWQRPVRVCDRAFQSFLRVLDVWRDEQDFGAELVGRAMYKPREVAAAEDDDTATPQAA